MASLAHTKYFLMATVALTLMATDLYLPAMPMMVEAFHTTNDRVQFSISSYLISLSFMALIYGPLSDAIGRKKTYFIGQLVFLLSSIALIFVNSIELFLVLRFLQGAGGACSSISSAVVSDIYDDKNSGKIIAQMSVVIVLSPAFAPVVGGYIASYLGWRYSFVFFAVLAGILLAVFTRYFQETKAPEKMAPFKPMTIIGNYMSAFRRPLFMSYVILHSLAPCATWCLITTQPFVFINTMQVSVESYGYYIMLLVLTNSLFSYVVQHLITRTGPIILIKFGIASLTLSAVTIALSSMFAPYSPMIATLSILPIMICMPLVFPAAVSRALSQVRDISGTGSATISFARQSFGFLGSVAAGFLTEATLFPTAIFIGCMALIAIALFIYSQHLEKTA